MKHLSSTRPIKTCREIIEAIKINFIDNYSFPLAYGFFIEKAAKLSSLSEYWRSNMMSIKLWKLPSGGALAVLESEPRMNVPGCKIFPAESFLRLQPTNQHITSYLNFEPKLWKLGYVMMICLAFTIISIVALSRVFM